MWIQGYFSNPIFFLLCGFLGYVVWFRVEGFLPYTFLPFLLRCPFFTHGDVNSFAAAALVTGALQSLLGGGKGSYPEFTEEKKTKPELKGVVAVQNVHFA